MQTARIIAALGYAPAIVILILAIAWAISVFCWVGLIFPPRATGGQFHVGIAQGNACLGFRTPTERPGWHWERGPWVLCREFAIGEFGNDWSYDSNEFGAQQLVYGQADCPIGCLITLLLPLAIGPFVGFRFRLWMLLAWTAVIAAECAYFTRSAGSFGIE